MLSFLFCRAELGCLHLVGLEMAIMSVRVVAVRWGRHWPLIRRVERGKANQKRKASNRPYILEHSACNESLGINLMVKTV